MCTPVHFPWLPGYTDVMQSILIILTMVGLFSDSLSIADIYQDLISVLTSVRSFIALSSEVKDLPEEEQQHCHKELFK